MNLVPNLGRADRGVRAGVGLLLIFASLVQPLGTAALISSWVLGGVLLSTAAAGSCPLYRVLGLSTCRV